MRTVIDYAYAQALNSQNVAVKVYIKIDTGMPRLGILCEQVSDLKNVFRMCHMKVRGIFTHLSCSDSKLSEDVAFTRNQTDRFYDVIDALRYGRIEIPKLHI